MQLSSGHSLAYCTNVHRGEGWSETFSNLKTNTLKVRQQVSPNKPYAVGLRLGNSAARELASEKNLNIFREWLEKENCHVSGINGFPYGAFHGQSVKESVFLPDWTDPSRLEYTQKLFEILAALNPPNQQGTVSTLPGTFKKFNRSTSQIDELQKNILACAEYLLRLRDRTGVTLKLALEPEPLGYFENTQQTIDFFDQLRGQETTTGLVDNFLGVCYDTCHFALQYEAAAQSVEKLNSSGAPILKYHLSSALRLKPTDDALRRLVSMQEPTYLHQCIGQGKDGELTYFKDIPDALADMNTLKKFNELRVHFHLPLHSSPMDKDFFNTTDFLQKVLSVIMKQPGRARELEIETYTWEVLPQALRSLDVTDQVVAEYRWVLNELSQYGVRPT
jgi:sugar phosphate isomerase/epimerase